MKKVISIITNISMICVLILGIYFKIYGYSLFRVKTGSMRDEIDINDIILVKGEQELKENDIIAFEDEGALIVHRIIEKKDNYIITKGDANNQADDPITEEQIIGKVIQIIPYDFIIAIILIIITCNTISWLIEKYTKGEKNEQK